MFVELYVFECSDGEFEVYYFDLYWFNDLVEWFDVGFCEYFNFSVICFVEWL